MSGFRTISFLAAIIICTASWAGADEVRFDISRAWFKPELTVNNEPEICGPVFNVYLNYFAAPGNDDPLKPISTRGDENHQVTPLTNAIREMEWEPIGERAKEVRVVQWHQDGRYLGIVEKGTRMGWRPPTYEYYVISKPISETDTTNDADYGEGPISYLGKTDKKQLFDIIYKSDPRFRHFGENTFVRVANVYAFNHRTYLVLIATGSRGKSPNEYLITRVVSPTQLSLVCKFSTSPSRDRVRVQAEKIPNYETFQNIVLDIMGGGGDCGTLNSQGRAIFDLREAFDALIARPWTYSSHSSEERSYDFVGWGFSGAWNYRKYLEFATNLPKITQSLADKYTREYQLNKKRARTLAQTAIAAALERGFSHTYESYDDDEPRHALLEGKGVSEVLPLLPKAEERKNDDRESLLTFAIGHPRLVELLLKRGFDPNRTNAFGKTPLMYAAQFNDLSSAKLLVKYGANTESATTRPLDTCGYTIRTHGVTALHYAVRYASYAFIKWLVSAGAVTSTQDSHGKTAFDYLATFGGYIGYNQTAELSYGQQNALLTKSQVASLTVLLNPPSEEIRKRASDDENRKGEALYRKGRVTEAYSAVKKSLSLNPGNERALSNLSLIALKLGKIGESAKAASYVIKNAKSDSERASAYFNMGLACEAESKKAFHYASIYYDGGSYCQESGDRYQGPLYFYLKAYQIRPTPSRAAAIVEFMEEADSQHGKWLCKSANRDSNPRAVYVGGKDVYFLTKGVSDVSFERLAIRGRDNEKPIPVTKTETFALGNGYSLSHWNAVVPFQGTLVLNEKLCSRAIPLLINDGTEIVELYTLRQNKVALSAHTTKPILLVLYGNSMHWVINEETKNVEYVYVYGRDSTVEYPRDMAAVVRLDTKLGASSEPWGSSFNSNAPATLGLPIGAVVELSQSEQVDLDDNLLANLPACGGRNPVLDLGARSCKNR